MKEYLFSFTVLFTVLPAANFCMEAEQSKPPLRTSSSHFTCPNDCNSIIETGGQIVLLQTDNNSMYFYSNDGKQLKKVVPEKELGLALMPAPVDGTFATAYADGIALWNINTRGKPTQQYYTGSDENSFYSGYDVKFSTDGKHLMFSGKGELQGLTRKFNVENAEPLESSFLGCEYISPDGERGFCTTNPGAWPTVATFKPFDQSEKIIKEFKVQTCGYTFGDCDPSVSLYSIPKNDTCVEIWDTLTGEALYTIPLAKKSDSFIPQAFSQDSKYLAIAVERSLTVYDAKKEFAVAHSFELPEKYQTMKLYFDDTNNHLYVLSSVQDQNKKESPQISPRQKFMLQMLEGKKPTEKAAHQKTPEQMGRVDIFDLSPEDALQKSPKPTGLLGWNTWIL